MKNEDVCILIPTLNEEKAIGEVIRGFKSEGFENIFVIDGNSEDSTREIAKKEGARVEVQQGKGKGSAVKQAFEVIEDEIIVMIDGDGTYSPSEVRKLLDPIRNGEAEHVIGNRFAYGGAFAILHRIGNGVLNKVFGFGYGVKLNDILSGYRALTRDSVKKINLEKKGFEIEAEMAIESVKKGILIKEVPIEYKKREGQSKLNFVRDGTKIVYTLYVLARTHNPAFYFGVIGSLFIAVGILTGIYVVVDWFSTEHISHNLLTVFTALMVISGVQFLIFGLFGDLLVTLQKETIEALRGKDIGKGKGEGKK
ncbi:MAG: S-layer glycoprotein N-glycosyltransferase AglJ [Methanophagales archaeon]|nr:S-layer glycoprotein N-glycosyltransferase AglJ [Methanophagales archaeon]